MSHIQTSHLISTFLIQPMDKLVRQLMLDDSAEAINKAIGSSTFTMGGRFTWFGIQHTVYVDDNGLYRLNAFGQHPDGCFDVDGNGLLFGRGLVMGVDILTGESLPVSIPLKQLEKIVTFPTIINPNWN